MTVCTIDVEKLHCYWDCYHFLPVLFPWNMHSLFDSFPTNLISIDQSIDNGCFIHFSLDSYVIQDQVTRKLNGRGHAWARITFHVWTMTHLHLPFLYLLLNVSQLWISVSANVHPRNWLICLSLFFFFFSNKVRNHFSTSNIDSKCLSCNMEKGRTLSFHCMIPFPLNHLL